MSLNTNTEHIDLNKLWNHKFYLEVGKDIAGIGLKHKSSREITKMGISFEVGNKEDLYCIAVGKKLQSLLDWCAQLDFIPHFLNSTRLNNHIIKKGIKKHDIIFHHIENFYMRAPQVEDKILQLVNTIFILNIKESKLDFKSICEKINKQYSIDIKKLSVNSGTPFENIGDVIKFIFHELSLLHEALSRIKKERNAINHCRSLMDENWITLNFLLAMSNIHRKHFGKNMISKNEEKYYIKNFVKETNKFLIETNTVIYKKINKLFLVFQFIYQEVKNKEDP